MRCKGDRYLRADHAPTNGALRPENDVGSRQSRRGRRASLTSFAASRTGSIVGLSPHLEIAAWKLCAFRAEVKPAKLSVTISRAVFTLFQTPSSRACAVAGSAKTLFKWTTISKPQFPEYSVRANPPELAASSWRSSKAKSPVTPLQIGKIAPSIYSRSAPATKKLFPYCKKHSYYVPS